LTSSFEPTALVPAPTNIDVGVAGHHYRRVGYNDAAFNGIDSLLADVRVDIAHAKTDGRLPTGLRTLVSLNRKYHPRLSVTVRGATRSELFPQNASRMEHGWALALLQLILIADGRSRHWYEPGDEISQSRYSLDLWVRDVGTFTTGELQAIVDERDATPAASDQMASGRPFHLPAP